MVAQEDRSDLEVLNILPSFLNTFVQFLCIGSLANRGGSTWLSTSFAANDSRNFAGPVWT
jgi:hypothetical protein